MIQSTRPHALALGLNDSPAALAGWLIEKFRRWSDCDGDVESSFTKDELLSNVMIYWATGTINQSFGAVLRHCESRRARVDQAETEAGGSARSDVPAGFAMFPKDLSSPPREWAERFFDVRRWTEMPRGGHFAALEEPDLLVNDIREFFRPLRRV